MPLKAVIKTQQQQLMRNVRSIPGVWHVPVVAQAVTDKHVEGMFLIA